MLFKLTALNKAIAADDIAQVKDLLARYPQLAAKNSAYESMDTALAKASDDMVLLLSDAGWNLLNTNRSSRHALQEAVYCGRQAIITQWLERYPLLWTQEDCAKLLLIAVEKKDTVMLQFLLDSGISNPAHPLPYYENPLHKAQTERYQDAVLILRRAIAARKDDGQAVPSIPAAVVQTSDVAPVQWHMVDDTTIIRVREQAAAGYRLTDIFNFALGTCISVQRNLETNSETAVTLDLTAAASQTAAQEAHAQLERAGGNPPALPQPAPLLRKGGG